MNALVRIEADRVVADSRDVAADFGKRHDHVLRAIDTMVKEQSELAPNFGVKLYQIETGQGARRSARCFDMDRKGFMLLVMGFSGAKALAIKSRWIDAFDAMERRLLERQDGANDDADAQREALPPLGDMCRMVSVVETYRRVFGVKEARWMAARIGLPVPPAGHGVEALMAPMAWQDSTLAEFISECCVIDPQARCSATALYRAYQDWCAESGRAADTQTGFGRMLTRLGFAPIRNGHVQRSGLRLL